MLAELGVVAYAEALREHRRTLRDAFADHGGVEVGTEGDSFFVAFATAPGAVAAAREGQEALAGGPIRVRMGLHTGTPHLPRVITSVRMCTWRRGSQRLGTGVKCCCRRRPGSWSRLM